MPDQVGRGRRPGDQAVLEGKVEHALQVRRLEQPVVEGGVRPRISSEGRVGDEVVDRPARRVDDAARLIAMALQPRLVGGEAGDQDSFAGGQCGAK